MRPLGCARGGHKTGDAALLRTEDFDKAKVPSGGKSLMTRPRRRGPIPSKCVFSLRDL